MPVAAAAANALKKRNKSSNEKKEQLFPTPARYGWGQVGRVWFHFIMAYLLLLFSGCSSNKPENGPGTVK